MPQRQPRSPLMSGRLRSMEMIRRAGPPPPRLRSPSLRAVSEIAPFSPVDSDSLGGVQITETCADNATTAIILQLASQCRAFWIRYYMKRGSVFESGDLHIMLNASHASPEITKNRIPGAGGAHNAIGVSFTTALGGPSSLWVVLNVVVDNSSATDVDFRAMYQYLTN